MDEYFIPLYDFTAVLEDYLNVGGMPDFCPNGVQVEANMMIKKVATAVSATIETIEVAAKDGVDALIVHHGLFWRGNEYPLRGSLKKKVKFLFDNRITLLAYHLPLDVHVDIGNNWKAANDLGWKNLTPFGEFQDIPLGVKGRFSPRSASIFMAELEAYYSHIATYAMGGKEKVSSAALISGGAYKMLAEAAAQGVDCFVTGNFDEPAWAVAKEEEVNFFALGHSATERIGPMALASYIETTFKIPCHFIDVFNPF